MGSREYFGDRKALIDESVVGAKGIAVRRWRDPASLRQKCFWNASFLAHETSFICRACLRRSSLPCLSAGRQGFRRNDGNRRDELHSLAVYARASIRGNRLDLWFLDGTKLRCCSK